MCGVSENTKIKFLEGREQNSQKERNNRERGEREKERKKERERERQRDRKRREKELTSIEKVSRGIPLVESVLSI